MEATLPRPAWYSSDDEDSGAEDAIEEDGTEMRAPQERRSLVHVYTICVCIGFALNLAASCPVPWMRAAQGGRTYGVWRATGGGAADLEVTAIHDCSNEKQYWQAAGAFSVLATFFAAGAVISGIFLSVGRGHIGVSLALGFYGMAQSLVSWALAAALFHHYRCGKGTYSSFARLDAGFALALVACALHLVGTAVLFVHFATYYTKSVHFGKPHAYRFLFVALLVVVMLFWCVGSAYTQWHRTFPLVKVRVTMWHVEVYDRASRLSTFLGRREYGSTIFIARMKVVAGFNIMSLIFAGLALFTAMAACFNHKQRRNSNILAVIAWLTSFISWIVLLVVRHRPIGTVAVAAGESFWYDLGYNGIPTGVANGQISYKGYAMGDGFALIVTGWALLLVATVINCVIP
ncbi:hypothetical protein STCU_02026 [Strigomonas culicis]|uniref:Amastin-like protein n=1 Tax=Strigomonas culicis TaxID=28005 RepID=S9WCF0_9TRYP|nr:hypothetical protein STCU_02026 [Strigomonas culicis]|eukprot:EPY33740.1 hypothetical protein STCU_02026 [Strigomonas culicis]